MITIITKNAPSKLKGELSRILFSIDKNIFYGIIPTNKRLWLINSLKNQYKNSKTGIIIIWSDNNILGIDFDVIGKYENTYEVSFLENIKISKEKLKNSKTESLVEIPN